MEVTFRVFTRMAALRLTGITAVWIRRSPKLRTEQNR
jgi:hypothetical protein